MPPDEVLPAEQIAILEDWVRQGAADPRPPLLGAMPAREKPWSLQPIRRPPLPALRSIDAEQAGPIDRFLLSRLEQRNIAAAPPADQREWVRRVTFDLHGLPPAIDDVERFLEDDDPLSVERLVDRLLASPHNREPPPRRGRPLGEKRV
jgi:hypothetical protein